MSEIEFELPEDDIPMMENPTNVPPAALNQFKLGLYRHYKGGLYVAVGVAQHHETRRSMVLYISIEHGSFNVRPLNGWHDAPTHAYDPDGFLDFVSVDEFGRNVPRFEYAGPAPGWPL